MEKKHIVVLLVRDAPGVMTKITGLFARRNFNIDTINVGKTNSPKVSRIVLTLEANQKTLEQLEKQVNKLIDVIKVIELDPEKSVVRELCLVKVSVKDQNARKELTTYAETFRASIVDITHNSMVIQLAGKPEQIDSFLALIKKFGIIEVSRTGTDAIARGAGNGSKQGKQ